MQARIVAGSNLMRSFEAVSISLGCHCWLAQQCMGISPASSKATR